MVDNNIFLALDDSKQFVDTSLEVISTDSSVSANIYQNNFYISGNLIGHSLTTSEQLTNTYTSDIFTNPFSVSPTTDEWMPTDTSPFNSFNNWTPPIITSFQ